MYLPASPHRRMQSYTRMDLLTTMLADTDTPKASCHANNKSCRDSLSPLDEQPPPTCLREEGPNRRRKVVPARERADDGSECGTYRTTSLH